MRSEGTIGIDIGGTLAKLALAIPDGISAPALPEKFGFSGVADRKLRLHVSVPHPMSIMFLQGNTDHLEKVSAQRRHPTAPAGPQPPPP